MDTFVDSLLVSVSLSVAALTTRRRSTRSGAGLAAGGLSTSAASSTPSMHLLYTRFWTKAMRDLGLIELRRADEAAVSTRASSWGRTAMRMSKSRGNVVRPGRPGGGARRGRRARLPDVHRPVGSGRSVEPAGLRRGGPLPEPRPGGLLDESFDDYRPDARHPSQAAAVARLRQVAGEVRRRRGRVAAQVAGGRRGPRSTSTAGSASARPTCSPRSGTRPGRRRRSAPSSSSPTWSAPSASCRRWRRCPPAGWSASTSSSWTTPATRC